MPPRQREEKGAGDYLLVVDIWELDSSFLPSPEKSGGCSLLIGQIDFFSFAGL